MFTVCKYFFGIFSILILQDALSEQLTERNSWYIEMIAS